MGYIGRAATNAGSVNYLDDISSGFDGSDTTFTCAVKGTTITPGQENVYIYLDGVFQHPSDAYSISGSTITFTEAPVNGTDFTAYVAGEGAYLDDGTVSTAKLDDDAVTASKLDDDGTGFQVGDLGVGGSLTSGDKLTVTGRLRASGGIIGDLTGDVTGNVTGNTSGTAATVTGAAQSAITSVGTLTGLTVQGSNYTTASIQAGSTTHGAILNLGDSGDIDYGSITQFASGAGESGRMRFIAGTTEVLNLYSNGNATFAGTINSTIANTQTHSENTEPNSTTEFLTLHNNSGSDGAHTDKYVTMKMAVGSGGASEGHLIYRSSADNQGEFIFNSRHEGSTYNDILTLKSDKSATFAGNVSLKGDSGKLAFLNASGTERAFLQLSSTGLIIDTDSFLQFKPNNSEAMYINSSGFVGIQTHDTSGDANLSNTFGAPLHILQKTASQAYGLVVQGNSNANGGRIGIGEADSNFSSRANVIDFGFDSSTDFIYSRTGKDFIFGVNSAERMRIKADGVVQFRDGIRFLASSGAEPTGDEHHDVSIKIGIYKKNTDSTDISQGYIDIDHDIYRDNVLGVEAGIFDANLNIFKPGFANGDGWLREMTVFASGGAIRVYFGGSVAIGDIVKLVIFYTGNTG